MNIAAAADTAPAGWGRLVALAIAIAVFWVGANLHQRWLAARRDLPSPEERGQPVTRVKPQASGGSDPLDPSDDPGSEPVEQYEWGAVSGTPNRVEVVIRRPGEQAGGQGLEGWIAGRIHSWRPSKIIREGQRLFGVSESTIKRALRRERRRQS